MKNLVLSGFLFLLGMLVFGCTENPSNSSTDSPLTGNYVVDIKDSTQIQACERVIPEIVVVSPDSYSSDNVIIVTKTKLIGFDGYDPIRHPGTSWADGTDINVVKVPYCKREGNSQTLICDPLDYKDEYRVILYLKENNNWVGDRDKLVSNFTVVDYSCVLLS